MAERKTRIKPSRPRQGDPRRWAREARQFSESLRRKYPDREFSDSAEIIRADRDSRV